MAQYTEAINVLRRAADYAREDMNDWIEKHIAARADECGKRADKLEAAIRALEDLQKAEPEQ